MAKSADRGDVHLGLRLFVCSISLAILFFDGEADPQLHEYWPKPAYTQAVADKFQMCMWKIDQISNFVIKWTH
jgi:hypothetical protein